ncbi:MAG: rod shape-determining protein MreC [Cyanobacteria bacterium]|nr:rod shape-determining protein MreC [Cyanobacteriota bacterium]MDW8200593.1 rod shape-determining protein MreC [Cyanobacteriota bacterium SKYGB_h_bin112]
MAILRRWLNRHGLYAGLIGIAVGTAWVVRQTQGAVILDAYYTLVAPFQRMPTQEQVLTNARVKELQGQIAELESQTQRLQELLDYRSTKVPQGIVAPVIGHGADHWWQQITVGRGRRDGIQVGYIATAPGGLVGRVVQVTNSTSRVLLLSDASHRVGVMVSRSRHMGYLRGQTSNRAVFQFFEKAPSIRRGDVVVTSSYSNHYPAGIVVGTIESIDLNKSPSPEAVVQLSVPITYLEWVVLQPGIQPDRPSANNE